MFPTMPLAKGMILGTLEVGSWRCFLLRKATKKKTQKKKGLKDFLIVLCWPLTKGTD